MSIGTLNNQCHIEESPSGDKILYSSKEFSDTAPLIWYSKTDGALPTQLTQGVTPKWINEDKIVFMAEDENTNLETIWTLNIDGGMLTQLIVDDKFDCLQPVPSPDGNFIAFVKQNPKSKNPSESRDIYVYNVQSGLTQQLTTNTSRDDMPRWSTTGDKLLFRSTRGVNWNIWQVNTDTLKSM
jgi:Tol biopolymer transport system component